MIYSVVYLFQLFVIRYLFFVICCAFIRQLLFVINRSFISFVVRFFILLHFSFEFCCCCSKREKNNSDLELCSGISIPLKEEVPVVPAIHEVPVDGYLFQHHHLESINIIQQTPPTFS